MNLVKRIAGAARLLATGKLAQSTRFEGAQMQRRLVAWRAGGESINSLLQHGGELQRSRARQLVRSNPYASNAAASFAAHAVGAGIKPSSLVEDAPLKDRIQRLWLAWTDEADADGLTDFYGLQAMAARAMFEAGDCFFRFRPRRPEDALTVPLQLQMLSAEHLPLTKTETLPNGNEVVFGIELDRIGRRVAYHFHRTHPGDVRQRGQGELVRVPAEQVLHVFHPIAEGQIRGVPWVAPAMVRLWLLDQYDDAELDRKKVAAMFAGFVTRPGPDDVMGEDSAQKDADGAALVGLQPGTMQLLLPGEDIKFSDPADVGGTYKSFQYRTLLACSAAMGMPYPSGSVAEVRTITKPVAGTVRLYLDAVEQLSGWSVDVATGIVTFSTAPAAGVATTADFQFDVPVRFDTDHMAVTIESFRLHRWQQIPIVELRA